jgi:hypothetical protein
MATLTRIAKSGDFLPQALAFGKTSDSLARPGPGENGTMGEISLNQGLAALSKFSPQFGRESIIGACGFRVTDGNRGQQ